MGSALLLYLRLQFQSTPARSRRRDGWDSIRDGNSISIHSSAKPETDDEIKAKVDDIISIHSSAKPETKIDKEIARKQANFNPLQREAGDLLSQALLFLVPISIHSSAKPETTR